VYYTTKLPNLVSRQFEDEIILANFQTGVYFSLMLSAADVWLGLDAGVGVDEIIAAFPANDGADPRQDVPGFVEKLLAEGAIAPLADIPDRRPWSPRFGIPFTAPSLDRFDDLRELLFIDPVHDVGEAGWPARESDDV
jgi:hypothetical protein